MVEYRHHHHHHHSVVMFNDMIPHGNGLKKVIRGLYNAEAYLYAIYISFVILL